MAREHCMKPHEQILNCCVGTHMQCFKTLFHIFTTIINVRHRISQKFREARIHFTDGIHNVNATLDSPSIKGM